jgi:hypothetical protein
MTQSLPVLPGARRLSEVAPTPAARISHFGERIYSATSPIESIVCGTIPAADASAAAAG